MQSDTIKTHDDLRAELQDRFRVYAAEVLRDTKVWPKSQMDDFVFIYKLISDMEKKQLFDSGHIDELVKLIKGMNNVMQVLLDSITKMQIQMAELVPERNERELDS